MKLRPPLIKADYKAAYTLNDILYFKYQKFYFKLLKTKMKNSLTFPSNQPPLIAASPLIVATEF